MFGVYIHIPYCLQRCSYCDFATYEHGSILAPKNYVELLRKEIRQRSNSIAQKNISTIFFGGGTPSLIDAKDLVSIITELKENGFHITPDAEITIEINPATIDPAKLDIYQNAGVNRFSVGAQSFHPHLLKIANRKHSANDTRETLELLKKRGLNYSFDLLFALPSQTLKEVEADVMEAAQYAIGHLSAYCLTVPDKHPMAKGRAPEDEQVEMFHAIESTLKNHGLDRYEISNFAKPGFESKHNLLYWTDQEYWGIGLSAHSYLKNSSIKNAFWGARFWNPNNIEDYQKQISNISAEQALAQETLPECLPKKQFEVLEKHQSLTDYCHVFMRIDQGISIENLSKKYDAACAELVLKRLGGLQGQGLVEGSQNRFRLTREGRMISNYCFEKLAFLADEIT